MKNANYYLHGFLLDFFKDTQLNSFDDLLDDVKNHAIYLYIKEHPKDGLERLLDALWEGLGKDEVISVFISLLDDYDGHEVNQLWLKLYPKIYDFFKNPIGKIIEGIVYERDERINGRYPDPENTNPYGAGRI